MKHTPGPWQVALSKKWTDKTFRYFEISSSRSIHWIAKVLTFDDGLIDPCPPEYEANARLIAAAPELLEALKAARQEFDECCADTAGTPSQQHFAALMALCDAAIAKAEGADTSGQHETNEAPSEVLKADTGERE